MLAPMKRIGVIGGGAWGTALAALARRNGAEVGLWAREAEVVEAVNRERRNPFFLPGVELEPGIRATGDLAEACRADTVLLAVPAQHMRAVCEALAQALAPGVPAVLCAKGIEQASGRLMSEIAAETLPEAPLAVLSGPTFAVEVAAGLPAAVTLACADRTRAEALRQALGGPAFRPYLSEDVRGAQIGGAVKNVLAIACGIVEGRRLGENARAALITRGMAEMMRLGGAMGARPETLMGTFGDGRSGADRDQRKLAQHRARQGARRGRSDRELPRFTALGRRGRMDRRRARRHGGEAGHRHADRGGRGPHRQSRRLDRCHDRTDHGAPPQGRGLIRRTTTWPTG